MERSLEDYVLFPGVELEIFLDLALIYLHECPAVSLGWAGKPLENYTYVLSEGDTVLLAYSTTTKSLAVEPIDILPEIVGIHGQDYATICQAFYNAANFPDDILKRAREVERRLCSIGGSDLLEEMERRWSIYS
jgi:hypothetical protein